MTDTKFFTAIAIDRKTGTWRKFFSIIPGRANELAKAWLRNQ